MLQPSPHAKMRWTKGHYVRKLKETKYKNNSKTGYAWKVDKENTDFAKIIL